MQLDDIRNIGIAAHIDAGKTTVTERILYYSGRVHRLGNVDDGNTTTDWMAQEQERGITIVSASTSCLWKAPDGATDEPRRHEYRINIIDTPGHVDFTVEVERCLRVLDGVVVVFCGVGGVQAQSETVWHQARRYGVPRMCFINKLDRKGADFHRIVEEVQDRLGAHPLPIQIPMGTDHDFVGVIDLVHEQAIHFLDETLGAKYEVGPIPEEYADDAEYWRLHLIEALCEEVEWLGDMFLAEEPITPENLRRAIRAACIGGNVQPVLCGTALRNRGVQPLMDAICHYLPSPADIPAVEGIDPKTDKPISRTCEPDAPLSALAFKIQSDRHGDLYHVRIYSGTLKQRSRVYNSNQNIMENVTRVFQMHANSREPIETAGPGSIVAVAGLRKTVTGDTLSDRRKPIVYERIHIPETVISMAIEPRTQAEKKKLDAALERLAREDPTFLQSVDPNTGQLLVSGMGELHLEVIRDRLLREFNVDANVGKPRVSYRESLKNTITIEETFQREMEGHGQFARVTIKFEPVTCEAHIEFVNATTKDVLANHFVRAVQRSLTQACSGALFGFPLINIRATLLDAETHPVDSSEIAFEAAASIAQRRALEEGGCQLYEPYMRLHIIVPEDNLGDAITLVNACRGIIHEVTSRESLRVLRSEAPLSELFGFATKLRSLTQGRGTHTMEPIEYRPAPPGTLDIF